MKPGLALLVLSLLLSPVRTHAWGNDGHKAVAAVAETRLSPEALAAVKELLQGESMADVALWADVVKFTTHKNTRHSHYVDVPIDSDGYDPARDCGPDPKGVCILKALPKIEGVLRNPSSDVTARREALKFVIHYIGDLHQPLHCAEKDGDGGGNATKVSLDGAQTTELLHSMWDMYIISASQEGTDDVSKAANTWLTSQDEKALGKGSFQSWAKGSFFIARDVVYKQIEADNQISKAERQKDIEIIHRQIAKAGVRLAAVLNRVFAK